MLPWDAALAGDECQVWWARPTDPDRHLVDLLDAHESARLAQIRHRDSRRQYVAAHALARQVLGARLGRSPADLRFDRTCPRCGGPHGKPRLLDGSLELSLSHAAGLVAVAITSGPPVGVDVESIERHGATRLERALAPPERLALAGRPEAVRHEGFLRVWTRKEAAVKATGRGLRWAPAEVVVSAPHEPPRVLAWPAGGPEPGAVYLTDLQPPPGYVGTVACLDRPLRVTQHPVTLGSCIAR